MKNKESMKQAGYKYVGCLTKGCHVLYDNETGKYEKWFCNKNHASYGIKWNNTHLEFASSKMEMSDYIGLTGKLVARYYKNKSN